MCASYMSTTSTSWIDLGASLDPISLSSANRSVCVPSQIVIRDGSNRARCERYSDYTTLWSLFEAELESTWTFFLAIFGMDYKAS